MSAANASTAGLPEADWMSAAADSARARSRPTMPTRAPSVASPIAVALPIPPVPPVIRTTLPAIGSVPATLRASVGDRNIDGLASVRVGPETLEDHPESQHKLTEATAERKIEDG